VCLSVAAEKAIRLLEAVKGDNFFTRCAYHTSVKIEIKQKKKEKEKKKKKKKTKKKEKKKEIQFLLVIACSAREYSKELVKL